MRNLKFKAQPTNVFFATVNQMFGGSSELLTTAERVVIKSLSTGSDNETVLGSSRRLGGAVERLIDGSEKRICRLSFALSPHVIERCSNPVLAGLPHVSNFPENSLPMNIPVGLDFTLTQSKFPSHK